jgi:hypothetical protein
MKTFAQFAAGGGLFYLAIWDIRTKYFHNPSYKKTIRHESSNILVDSYTYTAVGANKIFLVF